jgi:hypothetical protein
MKNITTTNTRAVAAGLGTTVVWRIHADDDIVQFPTKPSVIIELLPLMATVLVAFLVIGAALPVLPLFVHDVLGFGPAMVGVVAGCQFAAALIARIWSGQAADRKGAKWAVMAGLAGAALAGLLYLCAFSPLCLPRVSIAILLAGRAMLGGAESFIITGATTWGLARAGAHNAGKVIAWMGTAMFAAFAAGADRDRYLRKGRLWRDFDRHHDRATCHFHSDYAASPSNARAKRRPRHSVRGAQDLGARSRCSA